MQHFALAHIKFHLPVICPLREVVQILLDTFDTLLCVHHTSSFGVVRKLGQEETLLVQDGVNVIEI